MDPLSVPGTLESLAAIRKYVRAAAIAAGLDKKTAYRLGLAVDEVATNIITHGYAEAGLEGTLDLRAEIDETALTISIEDTGVSYDPQQSWVNPDELDLPLGQRTIGGLGVYLAMRNVDKFFYEPMGDKNRHTFVVNCFTTLEA